MRENYIKTCAKSNYTCYRLFLERKMDSNTFDKPDFFSKKRLDFKQPSLSESLNNCLSNLKQLKNFSRMSAELETYISNRQEYLDKYTGKEVYITNDGIFFEGDEKLHHVRGPRLVLTVGAESRQLASL